jgi:hypothetical protein
VTVWEGRTEFRLSTIVAPPGGATSVQTTATATRTQASANAGKTTAQQSQQNRPNPLGGNPPPSATNAQQQNQAARNLKYPFAILEMHENEEVPAQPPPPPS